MCDQDYVHNLKKLLNPLDHAFRGLRMGEYLVHMNHLQIVSEVFPFVDHGLGVSDIERRDRQNWRSAQKLTFRKIQECLEALINGTCQGQPPDITLLGTKTYLLIIWYYVEIFCSYVASLTTRIKYAAMQQSLHTSLQFGGIGSIGTETWSFLWTLSPERPTQMSFYAVILPWCLSCIWEIISPRKTVVLTKLDRMCWKTSGVRTVSGLVIITITPSIWFETQYITHDSLRGDSRGPIRSRICKATPKTGKYLGTAVGTTHQYG